MAAGFALIGAIRWEWHATLFVIAALFAVAALVAPRALGPVYRVWMAVGEVLAWINTRIILTLVFFLVVTPTGLVMRLFGRSPLERRRSGTSYWDDVSYRDRHLEKQF